MTGRVKEIGLVRWEIWFCTVGRLGLCGWKSVFIGSEIRFHRIGNPFYRVGNPARQAPYFHCLRREKGFPPEREAHSSVGVAHCVWAQSSYRRARWITLPPAPPPPPMPMLLFTSLTAKMQAGMCSAIRRDGV